MPSVSGHLRSAAAVGLAGAVAAACVTAKPVEPGDRALLVTAGRLAEFGLELPDGYERHESLKREHVTGGAILIEYEFDGDDDDAPFYVYSLAELHRTPGDACRSFAAGNIGLRLSGLDLTERDDLFRYGEKSRFALVENDGEPVGNLFNMCRSRTALLVMFVGLYFDDADLWRELVTPHLEALAALEAASF